MPCDACCAAHCCIRKTATRPSFRRRANEKTETEQTLCASSFPLAEWNTNDKEATKQTKRHKALKDEDDNPKPGKARNNQPFLSPLLDLVLQMSRATRTAEEQIDFPRHSSHRTQESRISTSLDAKYKRAKEHQ